MSHLIKTLLFVLCATVAGDAAVNKRNGVTITTTSTINGKTPNSAVNGQVLQLVVTYSTVASTTYTVLSGYTTLEAKLWGGGSSDRGAGAIKGTFTVQAGDVIHVRVGAGDSGSGNAGHGTALKVVRSSSIVAKLLAGGAGNNGTFNAGNGVGGVGGGNVGTNGNSNSVSGAVGGTGGTRSAGGTGENPGGGPYDFTTFGVADNGGAGGGPPGEGGKGGGGYYGGGGGQSGGDEETGEGAGGGGGSGFDENFTSVTTYSGSGSTAGNSGDANRPTNAGNGGVAGAGVLILY